MHALSASQLLSLWEYGLAQPGWQRALILLAGTLPDSTPESLASLPLGQRNAHLLVLRENLFGPQFTGVAACPSCGERLELSFDVADVRAQGPTNADDEQARAADGRLSLTINDYEVTFRLPNSLDLAEIADLGTPEQARLRLLERCMLSAEEKGVACPAGDLPDLVTSAIAGRMASADPQGDVQIALTCPNCTHQWQTAFDILSFLWIEINDWAQRVLREVHLLASAYAWREADILALSPQRRQAYLQMVMG